MVYVAPSPSRPRPYSLITNDEIELRKIMEAEKEAHHLAIKNHQHRDTGWKMLRMRAEGSEFYCYDSIIVNGGFQIPLSRGYEHLANFTRQGSCSLPSAGLRDAERPRPGRDGLHSTCRTAARDLHT